jgi:hypothetical protein
MSHDKIGADDFIRATGATAAILDGLPSHRPIRMLDDVHRAFGTFLAFPGHDYELVDVALATVAANLLPCDPLWLFLVGPPSSGKTEVIGSLGGVSHVFPLSSLTPQTFASGFESKSGETSLLPRLHGKTLTMKDFGTVLTMYREKKAEILAQLREIYDGSFSKRWGNGKALDWTGKVGLLAGVTPIIDREYSLNQVLGERFLLYRVTGAAPNEIALRALRQTDAKRQRQRLREIVAAFFTEMPHEPPSIPEPVLQALVALAVLAARARSPVFFDIRNEIDFVPPPESPGRIAKQLGVLAQALALVRGAPVVDVAAYTTVARIAQDTMPAQRRTMLDVVLDADHPEPTTTTAIAEATGYPTSSARRYLQELTAHGLVTRIPEGLGKPDRWRASEWLVETLKASSPENLTRSVRDEEVKGES